MPPRPLQEEKEEEEEEKKPCEKVRQSTWSALGDEILLIIFFLSLNPVTLVLNSDAF